jgi:hypothetical protein
MCDRSVDVIETGERVEKATGPRGRHVYVQNKEEELNTADRH